MASITKRGKSWQARISYKTPDGKKKVKTKGGFKTKREAQLYADQLQVDRENGAIVSTNVPLFADYFWQWFQTYKESTVRERTKLTYVQAHHALKKYLPNTLITDLDRRKYQLFIKKYGTGRSKSTVSKMNSLFHACVKDAVYDGLIKRDFIDNVSLVYDRTKTRKIEYLNEAETKTLLSYLIETRNPHFTSKYMLITALATGMRPGEIQGLRWSDINKNFNTITTHQSWNETDNDFQPLKNESSYRTIRINSWLTDLLFELPKNDDRERVFVNQYKTIPTSSAVNKTLRESLKKNGISRRGFHFHSCRHTHVAFLLSQGIDIYAISKRLGHSNVTITASTYAYLIDEYKAKTDNQITKSIDLLKNPKSDEKNQVAQSLRNGDQVLDV